MNKAKPCGDNQCSRYDTRHEFKCDHGNWKDMDNCSGYFPEKQKALDVQVGGDHYKNMAIQPIEFTHKNNLNFCQGNIIKYVTRYKSKNGIEDLKKVKHYVDLLIQLEYGDES
jgi:hypothetical protein